MVLQVPMDNIDQPKFDTTRELIKCNKLVADQVAQIQSQQEQARTDDSLVSERKAEDVGLLPFERNSKDPDLNGSLETLV